MAAETTIDVLEISSSSDDAFHRFHLDLRLSRTESCLILSGRLDDTSVNELTAVLARLDALPRAVVRIDALAVTDTDPIGVRPLLDAAHRRSEAGAAPLVWEPVSPAVGRLLSDLGLDAPQRWEPLKHGAVAAASDGGGS